MKRTAELAATRFDNLRLIDGLLRNFASESLKSVQRFTLQFALPNNEHTPSCCLQRSHILGISLQVALKLRFPSFGIRCGLGGKTTASVLMPETPVYKDR